MFNIFPQDRWFFKMEALKGNSHQLDSLLLSSAMGPSLSALTSIKRFYDIFLREGSHFCILSFLLLLIFFSLMLAGYIQPIGQVDWLSGCNDIINILCFKIFYIANYISEETCIIV